MSINTKKMMGILRLRLRLWLALLSGLSAMLRLMVALISQTIPGNMCLFDLPVIGDIHLRETNVAHANSARNASTINLWIS